MSLHSVAQSEQLLQNESLNDFKIKMPLKFKSVEMPTDKSEIDMIIEQLKNSPFYSATTRFDELEDIHSLLK